MDARLARKTAPNEQVAGYLPATRAVTGIAKPWVMLGAHYDHLGHGGRGSSLARAGEETKVHPGADDNASGVAAVLTAAAQIRNGSRGRNVAFTFWSGEESGLLGSAAFTAKPPVPLDQLAAYFNFDMVGRLRGDSLQVQAAGSSSIWPALAESANVAPKLKLTVQADPNLATRSRSTGRRPTWRFHRDARDTIGASDTADRSTGRHRSSPLRHADHASVARRETPAGFARSRRRSRRRRARA